MREAACGGRGDRDVFRERYVRLLTRDGSQLLQDERVKEQVLAQMDSVVAAAYADLGLAPLPGPGAREGLSLSATIGRGRAVSGVHPSQSLHAASLIFEAALPVLASILAEDGRDEPSQAAALALNRAIMARMSVAAEFYIGFLLEKVYASHRDERRRLSRDLHDILAPAIAVGLQDLQLHDVYARTDPAAAEVKLTHARTAMQEALATLRTLAAESRESVGRNGLEYAIRSVVKRGPHKVSTTVVFTGDPVGVSGAYQEELFLIVSEALRNAFNHAAAEKVTVEVDVHDHDVVATIRDDGAGFVSEEAQLSGRFGLTSMRERAELLGGQLAITSEVGHGTTVTARIPLPRAGRDVVAPGVEGGRS